MRILIIEDDQRIKNVLMATLKVSKYLIDIASDAQEAWVMIATFTYDLLLLDVLLPGIDGINFCQQLRSRGLKMPILLITARDDNDYKIKGLDAGADDYLIKPFDTQELLARIRALLRRRNKLIQSEIVIGKLCLVTNTCEITYGGKLLQLTPTEYKILELFMRNSRRVFNTGDLITNLWSLEPIPTESTIRSHLRGLRKKLRVAGANGDLIETVHGLGYRLKDSGIEVDSDHEQAVTEDSHDLTLAQQQQCLAALHQSWFKFKDSIFDDVNYLQTVICDLATSTANHSLTKAIRVAHNLVGLLGSFGLSSAAKIAGEIENLLIKQGTLITTEIEQMQAFVTRLYQILLPHESVVSPDLSLSVTKVLVIGGEQWITQQLCHQANEIKLQVEIATNLLETKYQINHYHPDLILLDLGGGKQVEDRINLLTQINAIAGSIPVIVLANEGELNTRLQVLEAQATAFLQKPYCVEQIAHLIHQTRQSSSDKTEKILIVDDNPKFLELMRRKLASTTWQITTLEKVHQFWSTLETVSPNLLILDLDIPDVDGLKLCQLVRHDPHWHNLPIVFLTAYDCPKFLQQVFAVGGDDFISKSALTSELQTRIRSHLERTRRLQQMTYLPKSKHLQGLNCQ